MSDEQPIKIFISYSWQPEEIQVRVIEIANRLTRDGVQVILDVWDLKEGNEKYAFMEQMVNDETIDKVLLMCNSVYAEKANNRAGGVGTESTIVSSEIYSKHDQTKFIPVVLETDDHGHAYLPTFVKSIIYVDLSNAEYFEQEYDKLLRVIYKEPIHKRPPLGKKPIYLSNVALVQSPTDGLVKQIGNALIQEKRYTNDLIKDYFNKVVEGIDELRIKIDDLTPENCIDIIEANIDTLGVLRDDFESFLTLYLKYAECDWELLHGFFELIANFMENEDVNHSNRDQFGYIVFDSVRYFLYELFLSFVAVMLDKERYLELGYILRSPFLVTPKHSSQLEERYFTMFRYFNHTLDELKNARLNSRRISVTADTMKRRAKNETHFQQLIHADLLLRNLSIYFGNDKNWVFGSWYPITACYNERIKILPKMKSLRHFEKIKALFDVDSKEELIAKVQKIISEDRGGDQTTRNHVWILSIDKALRIDEIATIS